MTKTLQEAIFELNSRPMQKPFLSLLLAAALAIGGFTAQAAETQKNGEEQLSFLERYTNAAQDVILHGLKLVGINYRWGGNNEDSGLDCSGFVRLVFKETVGTLLPRTSKEMSEMGERVDATDLKPGDLVFFNTMRRTFSHVGIYLGDNYFLHAPRAGAEVRVENMASSYWLSRYNGARRILGKE